jgi:hypothetical protein
MHEDPKLKEAYTKRHKRLKIGLTNGTDNPGFGSYHYTWTHPTETETYKNIGKSFIDQKH